MINSRITIIVKRYMVKIFICSKIDYIYEPISHDMESKDVGVHIQYKMAVLFQP